MNTRRRCAPLVAIAGLMLVLGQVYAGEINVDCDKGGSIQKAIDAAAGSAARKTINVTGFCTEDLLISRDNISLLGDGLAVISGRIIVRGADGVTIRDLTVTGSDFGLSTSVSRVFMTNVHFTGNDGNGIGVSGGGAIFLRDGSIANNSGGIGLFIQNGHAGLTNTVVFSNQNDGILVSANGSLSMNGGSVHSHSSGSGIIARQGANVELGGTDVSGNFFTGVAVTMGSTAAIYDTTVNGNTEVGLLVSENSTVEVGGGELANNGVYGAVAGSHSVLRLIDTHVHGNHAHGVVVETDGGLFVDGTTVVDGNWADDQIECRGKEASMEIGPDAYVGTWACVDPDF